MTAKKFMTIFSFVLLAVVLLLLLVIPQKSELISPITFYYARKDYHYGVPNGAIGWEQRDVGGRENDLNYLLALYLEGPMSEELESPLPDKSYVRILNLTQKGDALHIQLSDLSSIMTDSEFTLASACLTKTILGMHTARAVQITSGNRSIRMNDSNLQFYDESSSVFMTEREEEK